jgi:hypothetical protein
MSSFDMNRETLEILTLRWKVVRFHRWTPKEGYVPSMKST